MFNRQRQKLLIDKKVQGDLTARVLVYWLFYTGASFCILAGFPVVVSWMVAGNSVSAWSIIGDTFGKFWPAFAASFFLVPLAIRDVLQMSNRFAGPIYRLRRGLVELGEGKPARHLHFREKDYWRDAADEYNRVVDRIVELEASRSGTRGAIENLIDDEQPVIA